MTPVELAKKANVKPQAIYNLIRQGYIKAERREVTVTRMEIDDKVAQDYLSRRAERAARKTNGS